VQQGNLFYMNEMVLQIEDIAGELESSEMSQKCPQCGAEYPSVESCHDRFDLCMALEFENPIVWAVHHLTVACYMLQHNEYSREGWLESRKMIAQFVRGDLPPAVMRKLNRAKFASAHRTWSVTRGAKFSEFDAITWSRTIAGIRLENPKMYCSDVRLWAASVLEDTETFLQALNRAP
jgi:hypothetical protein